MEKPIWENVAALGLTYLVLAATLIPLASLISAQDPPEFSDWSAPVNLGPPVNTTFAEIAPFISKDGLSLYHVRNTVAAGGFGGSDIWVSRRATINDPWGVPQNVGPTINTSANETSPSLSLDGHSLFSRVTVKDLGAMTCMSPGGTTGGMISDGSRR
jgi:hypothetical protein